MVLILGYLVRKFKLPNLKTKTYGRIMLLELCLFVYIIHLLSKMHLLLSYS